MKFIGSLTLNAGLGTNVNLLDVNTGGSIPYPDKEITLLFSGQSNSVSRADYTKTIDDALELPYDGFLPRVEHYNITQDAFLPTTQSMNQYLADVNGDFGHEFKVCKELIDGRKVGSIKLLKYAEGGISIGIPTENPSIGKWNVPNGARTLDLINTILPASGINHFNFIVWMQGESDAYYASINDDYQANLSGYIQHLRDNSSFDYFVIVRLAQFPNETGGDWAAGVPKIQAAQDAVALANSDVIVVTPNPDMSAGFADPQHYPLDAQASLGQNIYDAIKNLI